MPDREAKDTISLCCKDAHKPDAVCIARMSNNGAVNRYNLPVFSGRRVSHQSADGNDSLHSHSNITNQTLSSTSATSMLSTPSNNIRRIQEQRQQPPQHQHRLQRELRLPVGQGKHKKTLTFDPDRDTISNVKSKLLNLLKSSKRISSSRLASHSGSMASYNISLTIESIEHNRSHLVNTSDGYDYSVFTKRIEPTEDQPYDVEDHTAPTGSKLNPPVKESQIRAWESAEQITKNLIFDASSDSDTDDEEPNIIQSIPGYTKEELNYILSRPRDLKAATGSRDYLQLQEEEEQQLWEFRQRHQIAQERIFAQYLKLSDKRKVQIAQKKELLGRIFGDGNKLNQYFITNNTSLSTLDNLFNMQSTFEEEKEELRKLLDEHKEFERILHETAQSLVNLNCELPNKRTEISNVEISEVEHLNQNKFRAMVAQQLEASYKDFIERYERADGHDSIKINDLPATHEVLSDENIKRLYTRHTSVLDTNDTGEEMQAFALTYLKRCVKQDLDDPVASGES